MGRLSIEISKASSSSSGPQWIVWGRAWGGLVFGTVVGGWEEIVWGFGGVGAHIDSWARLRARYRVEVFILYFVKLV